MCLLVVVFLSKLRDANRELRERNRQIEDINAICKRQIKTCQPRKRQ